MAPSEQPRKWTRAAARQKRYRDSNEIYRKSETERQMDRAEAQLAERRLSPFVGWDTEGDNDTATPFLFGSSMGDRIAHPKITTVEMLDLILERERKTPNAIHVVYGAEYDFNMMLRNLPKKNLMALRETGRTVWGEYHIEHIPRKWFAVKHGKTIAKIFDVVSFFAAPYVKAITEHGIGTEEERALIIEGKAGRSSFTFGEISFIEPYWRAELRLLPLLMDKVRDAFYRAGVFINSWHGPGSLARFALRHQHVKDFMAESPKSVAEAARYAFCGGRFEPFAAGLHDGRIYNADINSAYPFAAAQLPNLATGKWVHQSAVDRTRIRHDSFGLYRIRYSKTNATRASVTLGPFPLFRRYPDDRVQWQNRVEGWYWGPEAWNVRDDANATFLEAWLYVSDGTKPFKWIAEYFDHRLALKRIGDPMQLTFKLLINSVYGQFAMRAGWERYKGAPPYHQLEFAGYITSTCRAMVHRAARRAWEQDSLISIDTDGIFTTRPIDEDSLSNGVGSGLGEWELSEYPGMLFWQSGVYFAPDDSGEWSMIKARGAPKGQIPYDAALAALGDFADIRYTRNELRGYRWSLRNDFSQWRHFVPSDRSIAFGGSSYSKRQHVRRACRKCLGGYSSLHDLAPANPGFTNDIRSRMHILPWMANDHERSDELDPIDVKAELEGWIE